jgi:hypothetical protein
VCLGTLAGLCNVMNWQDIGNATARTNNIAFGDLLVERG